MSTATQQPPSEPQEPVSTKYMTILEHLQELRYRLVVAGAALVVTTGASFVFAKQILEFLKQPAEDRSSTFVLIFTEPMEGLVAYFRVALLVGLVAAMPIIIFELLMFVTPALTRQEKRWVYAIVVGASLAFAGGRGLRLLRGAAAGVGLPAELPRRCRQAPDQDRQLRGLRHASPVLDRRRLRDAAA